MSNSLAQLKAVTVVVADTGDFESKCFDFNAKTLTDFNAVPERDSLFCLTFVIHLIIPAVILFVLV